MIGLKCLNVKVEVEIRMLGFKHSTFTKPRCNTKMELFHLHCSFFSTKVLHWSPFQLCTWAILWPTPSKQWDYSCKFPYLVYDIFLLSLSSAQQCFKATLNLKYLVTKHLKGEYQRLGTQKLHSGVCRVSGRVPTAYFIPRGNSVHTVSILERMSTSHANMVFVQPPGKGVSMGL